MTHPAVPALPAVPGVRTRSGLEARGRPIPLSRLVSTELRKMFDTRSGFWLMAAIAILALLATTAVIAFSADDELTYATFAIAIGYPMTVVLPIIAILSMTSEWSQRTGLTTFTLVPHRGRIVLAKAIAGCGVAVSTVPLTLVVAASGNIAASRITGVEPVWDLTITNVAVMGLANLLALVVGFLLGVLFRHSVGAIVAYFVCSFVLPTLSVLLATSQTWFAELQPWVDLAYARGTLVDGTLTAQQWTHLGGSCLVWLAVPLGVGLALLGRAEVT